MFLIFILTLFLSSGAVVSAAEPVYQWTQYDADQWSLWKDGTQIGGYKVSESAYYPRHAPGQWGEPCELPSGAKMPPGARAKKKRPDCPCCGEECLCAAGKPCQKPTCNCVLPAAGHIEADGTMNYGLDRANIAGEKISTVNGQRVSKDRLLAAIGKPSLKDDSSQLSLTVIGSDVDRQKVVTDLDSAPQLAPFKGRLKVQSYEPTHWAVKESGFVTTGKPTIYCQAANGKVLHRQDEYRGPAALAEVLRQCDPSYDAKKDPDLNKKGLDLGGLFADAEKFLRGLPGWAWLVICCGGLVLWSRRREEVAV